MDIHGVRIRESIVRSKLDVMELNQTIQWTKERLRACQMRYKELNTTVSDREGDLERMEQRLDYLEVECFGLNRFLADVCSGHGDCVDVDQCVCENDWIGHECTFDLNGVARADHSAVVYQDSMWIFGGLINGRWLNDIWKFHFVNNEWEKVVTQSSKPPVRNRPTAVVYQDSMWIFGGWNGNTRFHDVWRFDFGDSSWQPISVTELKPSRRRGQSAVVYQDSMWVFAGNDGSTTFLNDFWQFAFSDSWSQIADTGDGPQHRSDQSAVVYHDSMWIYGGRYGTSSTQRYNDCWEFRFTDETWHERDLGVSPRRAQHTAVLYLDAMWIFGGNYGDTVYEVIAMSLGE